jgi:hypothetical protein
VNVPRTKACRRWQWQQPLRVRIVGFASASSAEGHPAPDPFLLPVRAAVNWSARNNQRLLAAAEPEEEDDSDDPDAELDRMAEEEHLQRREKQQKKERVECRNPSWEELGRRLD